MWLLLKEGNMGPHFLYFISIYGSVPLFVNGLKRSFANTKERTFSHNDGQALLKKSACEASSIYK
jgi:hypothetical protein